MGAGKADDPVPQVFPLQQNENGEDEDDKDDAERMEKGLRYGLRHGERTLLRLVDLHGMGALSGRGAAAVSNSVPSS